VRLTIERMRTLVLATAALLLVALVAILLVGKGKNPFNRHDLPQRLGMEIQQEANGVTYTQARGGRTLFKIHASKVVELKQGKALLHDVKIELYGQDGRRVDRIEGSEFEYDQKAGIAKAAGQVEITLVRPTVAPAVALKSKAGQAVSDKLKGPLAASVAEVAARGAIHVKTSGLTFDQKSGVATTAAHVDFSMAQSTGSSMGATYESQQGLLVLDREVELTSQRGTGTVQVHAQHGEFERDQRLCRLRAAAASYRKDTATAGDAQIFFREDGSVVRLDAMNGFTLRTAAGGNLRAPAGQMDFDEQNHPRHGRLMGGVVMETARTGRLVHGTAPTATLDFTPQGWLRHAHLERGVTMDSQEQNVQAGQSQRLSRHWRSPVADVDFRALGHGRVEPEVLRGSGGVMVTGESQRGKGAVSPFKFSASEVTGRFGPGSQLSTMIGTGHASIEETTASGTRQTTSGDRLEVHLGNSTLGAKSTPKAGRPLAASGDGMQVQSATVEGHVVMVQVPAQQRNAKSAAPLRATAGRADYAGVGEWLHLTLSPRIENGALQLTANKVDISRASGDAFAHGNVKASWSNAGAGGNGQQGKSANQGLVHAISAEAQLHQATQEATFRGQARLWQQANSIAAPVIVLDRQRQTLTARTGSAADPVRVVLVSKDAGREQKKSNQPSVIRVRGGDLWYSETGRKAVMRGGVLGAVTAETGVTTSTSHEVEVTLSPTGKNGGQDQVNRMTARGHVVLTSQGRRGTGEQLVYTSANEEYVLTGTASAPPRMTDPTRGTVTGQALIFHGRDDSVSIEGGGRKTRTETTAPR
jgi:lipopolysaccharide export system protein LptA